MGVEEYRRELVALGDAPARWLAYLDAHSGLPGPRANLTLLAAFVEEASATTIWQAVDDADEYRATCGAAGIGRLLRSAEDRSKGLVRLRELAADERWRVREGVAMALQRWGDDDPDSMAAVAREWADGPGPLLARAAVAAICEPRLLRTPEMAAHAIDVCGRATDVLRAVPDARRRAPDTRTLRKGLGYGWSVAVAADPDAGLPVFDALSQDPDPDVAWVVRSNLGKARLKRIRGDR
ncbi:MAG TPA: PBS lyase heat domain-containing protein repeat-containing protein [Gordonia polyisoprenivorans]|nr:PBS lyase heat domain-containing protein repeat-containing protein [Gordonia polyisoprenivorans]